MLIRSELKKVIVCSHTLWMCCQWGAVDHGWDHQGHSGHSWPRDPVIKINHEKLHRTYARQQRRHEDLTPKMLVTFFMSSTNYTPLNYTHVVISDLRVRVINAVIKHRHNYAFAGVAGPRVLHVNVVALLAHSLSCVFLQITV